MSEHAEVLNTLRRQAHETATCKGFHDDKDATGARYVALIHSEVSGMLEELRRDPHAKSRKWLADGVPAYYRNGNTKANALDTTGFTRPWMAAVLGAHGVLFRDAESTRLLRKLVPTLGMFLDWTPPVIEVRGNESGPIRRGGDRRAGRADHE